MALRIITISDGYESASVPAISLPGGIEPQVYTRTLTLAEVTTGFLTLSAAPQYDNRTQLYWNGISQTYGIDFDVLGSQLELKPRLLTLVQVGDEITIQTI